MSIGLYSDPSVARGFIQVNGENAVEIAPAAIRLPAGSVSAPSITASGDDNNGIYFPAADTVAFTANGTKRFEVSSNGAAVTGNLAISSTGALTVPVGTSEQRPSPAASGMIRFNTTTGEYETYTGTEWRNIVVLGGNPIPVVNGGTGGTTASAARSNLSVVGYTTTTGSAIIPSGTTSQRDGSPSAGYIRFNSETSQFEGYNGSYWDDIGSGENITAANDTSTNASYYPIMVSDSGSKQPSTVSKSKLSFNPSTGTLTTVELTTTSDANLKTNINTITKALDKVLQLRGVSFTWKESNQNSIGLIAQEVEKILPEVVSTSEESIKSIAYINIVGILIEAIKEQQKLITDLADQVKNLKELC